MKGKGGFTLLEVLIVLIILGVLVAVGLPIYTGTIERARAKEALDTISAIKEAEARYAQEMGDFLGIAANQSYSAIADGLDIGWNCRYWDFSADNSVAGSCNIIANRVAGSNAGNIISLLITTTNYQGTWGGNHPGKPRIQ